MAKIDKKTLNRLYAKYNKREFVHPDPLEFLYNYDNAGDREVVGLIASALAYGRVAQILKSVSHVLKRLDASKKHLLNFKHRFTTGEEISALICGIKKVVKNYGSLEKLFCEGYCKRESLNDGLVYFVHELKKAGKHNLSTLLPDPLKKSPCKRLNLYLRWMVRSDAVDPGGWNEIPTSKLIVPLDVHMHRISRKLEMTERKAADIRTAEEITDFFRRIESSDPVKYDFALTRFGIRDDMNDSFCELIQ
ncbi:MAG: TIGR02757 family protein [Pseudomonadota bacterium]